MMEEWPDNGTTKQVGKMSVQHHKFSPRFQRRATYCRVCKLEIVPGEKCVTIRNLFAGMLTPPRLHQNCAYALAAAIIEGDESNLQSLSKKT